MFFVPKNGTQIWITIAFHLKDRFPKAVKVSFHISRFHGGVFPTSSVEKTQIGSTKRSFSTSSKKLIFPQRWVDFLWFFDIHVFCPSVSYAPTNQPTTPTVHDLSHLGLRDLGRFIHRP